MNAMLLFGVGITVLLVLFVGMYVGRKVEGDSQNFLVAGRIGLAIALLLSGIFIAKPMNEMGLFSLGDFFRVKYGRAFEKLASCVMILAYIILLAGNLVACGYLLEYFLGIPYLGGLFIAGGLVLLYTLCGGLLSDAYTSAIHPVITLFASVIIAICLGVSYGYSMP